MVEVMKLASVGSGASPESQVYFYKILTKRVGKKMDKRVGPLRFFSAEVQGGCKIIRAQSSVRMTKICAQFSAQTTKNRAQFRA